MKKEKNNRREALSWLKASVGKGWWGLGAISFCDALAAGSDVLSALVFKNVVDGAVSGSQSRFFFSMAVFIGLLFFNIAIGAISYHLDELTRFYLERTYKERIYSRLLQMDYGTFSQYHTGKLMNYLGSDITMIVENLLIMIPGMVSMAARLGGALWILIQWDWRFCGIYLTAGSLVFLIASCFRGRMKRLHKEVRARYDALWAYMQETMENMMVIRAFQAEAKVQGELKERLSDVQKARRRRSVCSNLAYTGFSGILDMGYLFGFFWCGFGILKGTVSYGTLTAVLQLISQVQRPLGSVTSYLSKYSVLCASAERLAEIESLPMEEKKTGSGKTGFSELALSEVSFSYENHLVLEKCSFRIRPGDFVAVTGSSGIGKSTLFKLLLALYPPDSGKISYIDGTGCKRPVSPDSRGLFSYVPQGNGLLSGSIWECVGFLSKEEIPTEDERERIRRACRIACAEDFIEALPKGYDTVIGERGYGISEGQAQRLSIARAVYQDCPVLLLDEATSALDEGTEERVLFHLKTLTDKTVLIVTHRKKALEFCSRVLRMEGKQLIEEQREYE